MRTRILLGGLAACMALMVAAGSASAATTRPITATSSKVVFATNYYSFGCSSATIPATLIENAGQVIAVQSQSPKPTYSGCEGFNTENPSIKEGPFTVTPLGWAGTWQFPTDATGLHVQLPPYLLKLSFPGYDCNLELEGTLRTGAVAAGHPATISSLPFNKAGMTIKAVNGDSGVCFYMKNMFEDGKPASFTGTYAVSPPFTLK